MGIIDKQTVETTTQKVKRGVRRAFIIGLLLSIVGLLIFGWVAWSANYSEGARVGTIRKFSKKGFVFKTYEGELDLGYMAAVPANMSEGQIWKFSVDASNADVIKAIDEAQVSKGKVKIQYNEKYWRIPMRGDTKYFVTKAEVVQ